MALHYQFLILSIDKMVENDKVILIVPMYCGNPSSLYFIFNERCQDYFMHNEDKYEEIVSKLYIIGVYGKKESSPEFIPCFEKWFEHSKNKNRVLGIERHKYNQTMNDSVLDVMDITNAFYEKLGFKELECFPKLWDEWNPCQIYVKYIAEDIQVM